MAEKVKSSPVEQVYEKYFDETYQMHYYYNPFTKESVWELPVFSSGAVQIIDKTVLPMQQYNEVKTQKEVNQG
jgi:hypothetical protein